MNKFKKFIYKLFGIKKKCCNKCSCDKCTKKIYSDEELDVIAERGID